MQALPESVKKLIRLPEVKARVGLSRSAIYQRIDRGEFPRPVNLGGRAVAWSSQAVEDWIQAKIEAGQAA